MDSLRTVEIDFDTETSFSPAPIRPDNEPNIPDQYGNPFSWAPVRQDDQAHVNEASSRPEITEADEDYASLWVDLQSDPATQIFPWMTPRNFEHARAAQSENWGWIQDGPPLPHFRSEASRLLDIGFEEYDRFRSPSSILVRNTTNSWEMFSRLDGDSGFDDPQDGAHDDAPPAPPVPRVAPRTGGFEVIFGPQADTNVSTNDMSNGTAASHPVQAGPSSQAMVGVVQSAAAPNPPRNTVNPALITGLTQQYGTKTFNVTPLPSSFSDGQLTVNQASSRWILEPLPYIPLKNLAKWWRESQNQPASNVTFDRLPTNFRSYTYVRPGSGQTDRWIWGHPKGGFRSVNEFYVHFHHMMINRSTNGCPCRQCTRLG